MGKKIIAIVGLVVSIAVIAVGGIMAYGTVEEAEPGSESYTVEDGWYGAQPATFGADFYTYIYEGVTQAVDALNSVYGGIQETVHALDGIYGEIGKSTAAAVGIQNAVRQGFGWVLIAIGAFMTLRFAGSTVESFSKKTQPAAQEQARVAAAGPAAQEQTRVAAAEPAAQEQTEPQE